MRPLLLCLAVWLGGCQLLTNFVRPLADPPDAPTEDAGPDGGENDASEPDAGS